MQPAGNYPGIGTTISQGKTMTVTGLAGYGDNRQRLTARRSSLPLPDKQQISILNGSNRPILPRQLHQETGIAFIGLVQ
jgi:hypothetical protein